MRFLVLGLFLCSFSLGQSLWLETGIGYLQAEEAIYDAAPKFGLRGTYGLGEGIPEIFAALAWREGIVLDLGAHFSFAPGLTDPFGLRAYGLVGLSYFTGSLGVAVGAAFSYELTRDLAVTFSYTHRPLFYPQLAQAFDASLGLRLSLGP